MPFSHEGAETEPAHVHQNQQIAGHRRTETRAAFLLISHSNARSLSLSQSVSLSLSKPVSMRRCARPAAPSDFPVGRSTLRARVACLIFPFSVALCQSFGCKRGIFLGESHGLRDVARPSALIGATERQRRA